jgi:hypothetical protein
MKKVSIPELKNQLSAVAELQRSGQSAPPVDALPFDLLRGPAPHSVKGVLGALLEEREVGR